MSAASFEQGTGFLQDNGFSVAEVYWELGQTPIFHLRRYPKRHGAVCRGRTICDRARYAELVCRESTSPTLWERQIRSRARLTASWRAGVRVGRFLKTFLLNGFNMAGHRRVFDGMHVFIIRREPASDPADRPWAKSSSDETNFANPDFPSVGSGPLTIGEITAKVEARGEVRRDAAGLQLPPRDSPSLLRTSLGRSGALRTGCDLRGNSSPRTSGCQISPADACAGPQAPAITILPSRLDWAPVLKALLARLGLGEPQRRAARE